MLFSFIFVFSLNFFLYFIYNTSKKMNDNAGPPYTSFACELFSQNENF